jgi:glycosyltransferase involved in cell wall biosynthesis
MFFFPSNIEGHPQVLGQAAACGLPAVAMSIYRPDYVVNGSTGFLAETDEELSGKLALLIHQPELRRRMGEASLAHAAKFDWDVIAREWLEVFDRVVAQRREQR